MLKKVLALILTVIVLAAVLVSCGGNKNDNVGGEAEKHVVFSPEVSVTLVKGKGAQEMNHLSDAIFNLTGKFAGINNNLYKGEGNEIVFGETDRELSKKAKQLLDSYARSAMLKFEDEGGNIDRFAALLVYSEGGSVAVVWTNNNIAESAVDFFLQNFVNNTTLILKDGYTYAESFDFIEFMEIAEERQRDEYLKAIEKQYDKEVATAVDNLWSMFDDRYVLWLADLYDPGDYDEEGNPLGGGFYYSNSARDNDGYGIDLESTAQILSFLTSSGMLPAKDGILKSYIPEKMQKEMVAFALSCQSPIDGCFYHPQWGMNIQESRKSRDHGWALDILGAFGAKPYFNSDLGAKGIYGNAPGYEVDVEEYISSLTSPTALTGKLSSSSVSAVSKVVTTASDAWTGSEMFKDLNAWIKYLEALEATIRTKSYSIGNTVSGLAGQAKRREAMALERGELVDANGDGYADGGYREMFQYYFNKWMLPENGLWEYGTVAEGTVTYAGVNALMKTIGAYNGFGFAHPYAEKAIESAIFIATLEGPDVNGETASNSVDVFNPFVAIELTLNNIKTYGDVKVATRINDQLKESAADIINITRVKIAEFQKADGSYGYTKTVSPSTSQGAPTSVPYTVEGDVNGGGIASNGVTRYLRSLFDFSMPLFWRSDFYKFIERASGNSKVLKGELAVVPAQVITFDDDTTAPSAVIDNMKDGTLSIVEDPRGEGNVMRFATYPTSGSSFSINPGGASATNSLVLEWEMCFEDVQYLNGTLFQIKIGSSYMFTCGVNSSGKLIMGDSSSVNAPLTSSFNVAEAQAYEWNKIRLEYYIVDAEAGVSLTKFYFNDQLRGVSQNFMGKETAGKTPIMSYNAATFSSLFATNMTVLFDNMYASKSDVKYVDEMIYNPDRVKDFEDAEIGTTMPANVTSEKGEIVNAPVSGNAQNKALLLSGKGESAAVKVTTASANYDSYVLETDMKIDASAAGVATKLYMADMVDANRAIAAYEIETYLDGDVMKAKITEFDLSGKKGESFEGIPVGEWFTLRIEFYVYRYLDGDCAKIYVNGNLVGIGSLWGGINTISRNYNYFYIVNASAVDVYLDNVIPENIDLVYTNENGEEVDNPDIELPKGGESTKVDADSDHDGVFDFDDQEIGTPNVKGLQTKVNGAEYGNNMDIAADPKDAANKVLMYRTMVASNGLANSMIFTASKNSPAGANCHVLEFDMLLEEFSGTLQISMNGSYSGNEQKFFNTNCSANMSKNTFTISGKTEKVSWPGTIVGATPVKGWVNVRFEYYKDQGLVKVYYDGELRGESDLIWNEANKSASFAYATFYTTRDTNCKFFVDNVVAESIKKTYVAETPVASGTPAGSEKDEIGQGGGTPSTPEVDDGYTGFTDFESYAKESSDILGMTLSERESGSASIAVIEDPIDAAGKVLKYQASSWKNRLDIRLKDNENKTKDKFSVSWDMNFTDISQKSTYQIFFGTDGDTPTYALELTADTAGKVAVSDINTTNGSASYRKTTKIADLAAGWHNIRVDYALEGGKCAANIWIDGYYILTSNNFYNYDGTLTSPSEIGNKFRISSTSNVKASMLLDNVSANYVEELKTIPVYEGELDFDNEKIGETKMLGFASSFSNDTGYAKVVEDSRDSANKVLEFRAKSSKNYVQTTIAEPAGVGRDRVRISFDMNFSEILADSSYQFFLGHDGSNPTSMLQVEAKKAGTYSVSISASTDWKHAKSVSVASGISGWHNICIEMEIVDGVFTANAYVDGDYAATSHNFYNYSGSATATPRPFGDYVKFGSTSNSDAVIRLDNIFCKFVETIKPAPVYEGVIDLEYYDVDKTRVLGMSTSFESTAAYAKVVEDPRKAGEKVLAFYALGTKNWVQTDMYDESNGDKTKAIISFDMNFSEISSSSNYQFSLGFDGSDRTYMLQLEAGASGKYALKDISSTNSSVNKSTAIASGLTGWHNICVEMEIVDGVFNANFYIDGKYVTTSHNFYNYSGSETAAPRAIGQYVRFSSTGGVNATMLLDNVTSKYVSSIRTVPVSE